VAVPISLQSHLPLLTAGDIEAIQTLGSEFEIDFISLTHTGDAGDIDTVRKLLEANNMSHVKVMAKVGPVLFLPTWNICRMFAVGRI
jgi:pyruvate kinase